MNPHRTTLTISAEDGLITITPVGWGDAESVVAEQIIPVLGGALVFRPDAEAGAFPRTLVLEAEPALVWLPAVYGAEAAEAVRAAWDSASHLNITVEAEPGEPQLVEALRSLARAEWYQRWWPSANPGDELQPRLDPRLLDLDLGTLAWECTLVLETGDLAGERLGRSAVVLLALLERTRDLHGQLREYVDSRLDQSLDATLDCDAGTADVQGALAEYREHRELADEMVRQALQTWLAPPAPTARELALAAGEPGTAPAAVVRFSSVDWTLVPTRSVSGSDLNVALIAGEARGGVGFDVRVEAGDQPVRALVAYLHAVPRQTLVARIDLPLAGSRYAGSAVVPTLSPADVDRIAVHVVATSVRPSPFRPDLPAPWLSPARLARAAADRDFIRRVLGDHLTRALDVANRPLLCEMVLA